MIETRQLTKSQQGFLAGIREKHNRAFQAELNQAIAGIVEELGLAEELKTGAKLELAGDYSSIVVTKPEVKKQPLPRVPGKNRK